MNYSIITCDTIMPKIGELIWRNNKTVYYVVDNYRELGANKTYGKTSKPILGYSSLSDFVFQNKIQIDFESSKKVLLLD